MHSNRWLAEVGVAVDSVADRRGVEQMVRVADVLGGRVAYRGKYVVLGYTG